MSFKTIKFHAIKFNYINFFACSFALIFFNQLQPSNITFGSKYSSVKIDSGAACIVEHPLSMEQGIINREEYGIIRGAPITFKNSTLIDCGNKTKITATIDTNNYNIILAGNNIFSGRNGTIYQPIYVSGKNNLIEGNLTLCNDIILQDSNTSVSVNLISNLNGNIYLNGGMLCLMENNLKFNDEKRIIGPGTIYENGSKLIYGSKPLIFNENIYFIDAEDIRFNANVMLQAAWTFSGSATIEGNSNILRLQNGKIAVEKGSSLLIKNIVIHDVQGGNLCCLDNNATVTFQNAKIYLSNDYTFSVGKFAIADQVAFLGDGKFIYQSPMASTILSRSTLILDNGITFSYDPGCMRKDLIVFEDAYSTLALNGATLHATLTGMQLTKGYLDINNNSCMSSESNAFINEGITIGNDLEQDDLYCEISKSAKLELKSGSLKYRNVLPSSWRMGNLQSSLEINANCDLYLYQNLNIEPGVLSYKGRGGFIYAPGKKLNGSLNVNGYIDYLELK